MKSEFRLPKLVEGDPRNGEIFEILTSNYKKLWEKSRVKAAFLPYSERFIRTLQLEHKRGRIVRSFELIERNLEVQAHGLSLVDEKTESKRGTRISRLLIISNDAAERFLRKVEGLLAEHGDRVLGLVIDADSEKIGHLFFGEGKTAKIMLLEHKESVANALFALAKESVKEPVKE